MRFRFTSRRAATRCAIPALGFLAAACGETTSPRDGSSETPTIAITQAAATLLPGDSVDLSLEPGAPTGVTWRIAEGEGVATVSAIGRVRAVAPGTARVVAEGGLALADTVDVSVPRLGVLTNGWRHFCAITVDGDARCFGGEEHGELGDGAPAATPNVVAGGHAFRAISAGRDHTCGVRTDGVAMCWGYNAHGQLGTGTRSTDVAGTPEPVAVAGPQRYVAIAAGEAHTCGLATDGGVYCWGRNDLGQLGSETGSECIFAGTVVQRCQPTPTRVAGTAGYRTLTSGHNFACAVDADGRAWCWGAGDWFSRGDGDDAPSFAPGAVGGITRFTFAAAGGLHGCAITAASDTYCWGLGNSGQNGAGGVITRPERIASLPPLGMVAGSADHSCGLTMRGEALCWGSNALGALGNGSASGTGAIPVSVAGGRRYATIAAGQFRTCAVERGGALYCWGEVFPGGMSPTPIVVAAGTEFQR